MQSEDAHRESSITDLSADDLPAAAALLARAYRDNPLTIALIGGSPEMRAQVNEVIFGMRIAAMQTSALVARGVGGVVGVCGFQPPGETAMSEEARATVMEALLRAGPEVPSRAMTMLRELAGHVPAEPHWHLGPVGVDPALQGHGIGGAMLNHFCRMVDADEASACLETETEAYVRLYEKVGFTVVDVAPVIGVPMWFMARRPAD